MVTFRGGSTESDRARFFDAESTFAPLGTAVISVPTKNLSIPFWPSSMRSSPDKLNFAAKTKTSARRA